MKPSRPSSIIWFAASACLLLVLLSAGAPPAQAQAIQVDSADPPIAVQGTANLNVLIKGNGFERGAISRFFVAGTADPGGITVKATTFFSSTELVVNIDVADAATIANFDIEVQNRDLRTGKGIEPFAVIPPGSDPSPPGYVGFVRQDYATGTTSLGQAAVVTADFNGDGVLDLATTNVDDNSVSVLLGNGDGTFQGKTDFATGLGPRDLAAADFNGDTRLDLATANFPEDSLSVLPGNGDGTFQGKTDYATGARPRGVVAADFNGDGRADLATANHAGHTISVRLGNGDGTFGARRDFVTSTWPMSIVAADFNGDGKLDVATPNYNHTANSSSVLLGNGDGTFGANMDSPTGSDPRSLTAVDFNLDGKLDLATANERSSTASVLLGQGNGTFNPTPDLTTDTRPVAVIAQDFDNDGKPDLAIAHNSYSRQTFYRPGMPAPIIRITPNTLWLRFGNGNGMFGDPLSLSLGSRGPREASAAAGDFNADGRVDLAITDPSFSLVTVLLQAPALSLDRTSLLFSNFQAVGSPSTPIDLTVSSTGSFSAVFGTASISGTDAGDFTIIADNCSGATVAAGSSCVVSVTFTPSSLGAKSASLTIPNNAPGNPHVVNLRGSGVVNAPVASVPSTGVNFGDQLVGLSLPADGTVRFFGDLTNIGGAPMNVSNVMITGTNASDFRLFSGGCPMTAFLLAPGGRCTLAGTFTPGAVGARSATVSITTDAPGSPHMFALSGNGVNLNITPDSPSRAVRAGQPAIFGLQFAAGGAAATLALSCSHSIPAATCSVDPNPLSLPGSATVTVMTTARAALPPLSSQRRFPPVGRPEIYVWVMAWLMLAVFLVGWRRPARLRLSAAVVATVVLSVLLWSGCSGGSSELRGTPPGTYQVTVSANAGPGTQAQSIQLTVTVQ